MKRLAAAFTLSLATATALAGAWGDGSFDNDDALDWVNQCEHATDAEFLRATFEHVLKSDEVEAPEGSAVIAAAEVVAASLGKPSSTFPATLRTWLDRQPKAQIATQAALARRALFKVEAPERSELRQLWSEGKANQWLSKIHDLESRLVKS